MEYTIDIWKKATVEPIARRASRVSHLHAGWVFESRKEDRLIHMFMKYFPDCTDLLLGVLEVDEPCVHHTAFHHHDGRTVNKSSRTTSKTMRAFQGTEDGYEKYERREVTSDGFDVIYVLPNVSAHVASVCCALLAFLKAFRVIDCCMDLLKELCLDLRLIGWLIKNLVAIGPEQREC